MTSDKKTELVKGKAKEFFGPDNWDCDGVDHDFRLKQELLRKEGKPYLMDMGDGTYAVVRPE